MRQLDNLSGLPGGFSPYQTAPFLLGFGQSPASVNEHLLQGTCSASGYLQDGLHIANEPLISVGIEDAFHLLRPSLGFLICFLVVGACIATSSASPQPAGPSGTFSCFLPEAINSGLTEPEVCECLCECVFTAIWW